MTSITRRRARKAAVPAARLARFIVAAACAAATMFSAACDVHGVSAPGSLSAIVVSPNPQTLAANGTQQFTAVGTDFSGAVVSIVPVWTVATGGGAIGGSGMFTAGVTPGTFTNTVTATVGGLSATATVIVTPGALASIVVTPNPASMAVGATQQFTAVGKDASGNVVQLTPTWSVLAGGGTLSATGLFTAGTTAGTFTNTIQASSNGIKGTATVTVAAGALAAIVVTPNPITLNVGAAQQFTATGRDANGNVVALIPTWSIVAGGGTIGVTGVFTAGNIPGTFANTVTATSGGLTGSATVTVSVGPLATITVSPNPSTVAIGAAQTFTAVGKDAGGNVVAITPTWSLAAGGGTIDFNAGIFTAGTVTGTYTNTVRATAAGVNGFATVVVTTGPLSTITVTPNPVTLQAGGGQQFTATGKDAGGNIFAIAPTWSVVNGGGSITSSGFFVAGGAAGTYSGTVQATSGGISGAATVNVTVAPPALATITVTPNPATVQANATQQFSAVGRDANGAVFPITAVWTIVNGGGTINSATGVFTAGVQAGTFTNTIKATSGAVSGFATVTVTTTPPVLTTITVTPNPAIMNTLSTQQFTAVGRDANGSVFLITPVWTVVNGGGAINPATGVFTSGATVGTFLNTVKATSGLVSGTATVNILSSSPPPFVDLGTAALNGIQAGTAVTCVALGVINANVSISPGGALSGFPPCVLTGSTHLADAVAAQNQIDLGHAYDALRTLPCGTVVTADLGGTTKLPGVYCNGTTMGMTGVLTLDGNGDPNAVFVFQIGTGLTTAGDVVLINGAQAKNVYWQVGSSATLGTASHFQGNILALTSITLVDNATMFGRALARNGAVTLGTGNVITLP